MLLTWLSCILFGSILTNRIVHLSNYLMKLMNKYQEPEVPKIGILLTEMGRN